MNRSQQIALYCLLTCLSLAAPLAAPLAAAKNKREWKAGMLLSITDSSSNRIIGNPRQEQSKPSRMSNTASAFLSMA